MCPSLRGTERHTRLAQQGIKGKPATREKTSRAEKPNKHQVRSKATQLALLTAAEKVFLRDGFELAQIDVIAAEAGRTRGAVYAHYEGKADLFLSVLRWRFSGTDERGKVYQAKEVTRGMSPREAFRKYYVKLHEPSWAILLLEFKLYALRRPREQKQLRRLYHELLHGPAAEKVYELGPHPNGLDAETRFSALMSFVSGVVLDMMFDPGFTNLQQARTLLGGVFDSLVAEDHPGFDLSRILRRCYVALRPPRALAPCS